jgi:hypothetical protein
MMRMMQPVLGHYMRFTDSLSTTPYASISSNDANSQTRNSNTMDVARAAHSVTHVLSGHENFPSTEPIAACLFELLQLIFVYFADLWL